ncbi:hypothetical protein PFISCL1PPCAC_16971, partial [Pristionchus fissidentatus]
FPSLKSVGVLFFFSSFSRMTSLLTLFLLPLLVFSKYGEVDMSGRLVCKAYNGTIVPVRDAVIELRDWNRFPWPHGTIHGMTKTDSNGGYRLIGGRDESNLLLYLHYSYSCDRTSSRSFCPILDKKCGTVEGECRYETASEYINQKCIYYPPNQKKYYHNGAMDIARHQSD